MNTDKIVEIFKLIFDIIFTITLVLISNYYSTKLYNELTGYLGPNLLEWLFK